MKPRRGSRGRKPAGDDEELALLELVLAVLHLAGEAQPQLVRVAAGGAAREDPGAGARDAKEALDRIVELYEAWKKPSKAAGHRALLQGKS